MLDNAVDAGQVRPLLPGAPRDTGLRHIDTLGTATAVEGVGTASTTKRRFVTS